MDELVVDNANGGTEVSSSNLSLENRLEIIGEGLRKKYLSRLTEMQIAPVGELLPLEEDLKQYMIYAQYLQMNHIILIQILV